MRSKHSIIFWFSTLALLGAFFLATWYLNRDSFWGDEGWSMWAVRDGSPLETLRRVGNDVHPPLYFILLDGWTALTGESVYAVRMLSVLCGMIGLSVTYAIGRQVFDAGVGLVSVCLLGTSGFWIYYCREARMYTLLLALGALATWIYLRWLKRPRLSNMLLYATLLALLLYTHYAGALIIATHGLHLLLTHPRRWPQWLRAAVLATMLYTPWIWVGLRQIKSHPQGPYALAVPSNYDTIHSMVGHLLGGYGGLLLLPSVTVAIILHLRRDKGVLALIVIWLLLTPVALLSINHLVMPFYQHRYVIAILPAFILVEAYGLYYGAQRLIRLILLAIVVVVQLATFPRQWPPKPAWEPTMNRLAVTRDTADPIVVLFDPTSVESYYDRQLGIRQGTVIDLNKDAPPHPSTLLGMQAAPSVWIALPSNIYQTWDVIAALDTERHVAYRDGVANLIVYRFDVGNTNDLHFQFGDQINYLGTIGNQLSIEAGETLCLKFALLAQVTLDHRYSAGVHLVDIQNRMIMQWDGGIGSHAAGEEFTIESCLPTPAQIGTYRLILVLYNWVTGERLPLFEQQPGQVQISWLDTLVIGTVNVKTGNQ